MSKYPVNQYPKGTVLFTEGEPGDKAYVLKGGKVELYKTFEGKKKSLAVLEPLSVFGEMVLFQGGTARTTTAEVLEDIVVLEMNHKGFHEFLDQTPEIMQILIKQMVERLRSATEKAVQLPQIFDSLANLLELFLINGTQILDYAALSRYMVDNFGVVEVYVDTLFDALAKMKLIVIGEAKGVKKIKILVKEGLAEKALAMMKNATDEDGGALPLG
ncbi:MAG: Crp/Fnr family transcriptional regulator [Desulfovibrio sp.]|nr:MAG: Crp/Fnr family transcriptional regulator [Desulfovibrio sp.]